MCIHKWLFIYGIIIWDTWCITALTTITLLLLIKTGHHLNQYKSCMISSRFPMNFHVQCVCLIPRSGSTNKKKANKSWTFKITCNIWTCTIRKHILWSLFSVFNDPDTQRKILAEWLTSFLPLTYHLNGILPIWVSRTEIHQVGHWKASLEELCPSIFGCFLNRSNSKLPSVDENCLEIEITWVI